MVGRFSLALTAASLPLIAAIPAIQAGNMVLAWIFLGMFAMIFALASALALAPRIPVLHRLPPPIGAMPPPRVTFHLEGHPGMSFGMGSKEAAKFLIVEIENQERDDIQKVHCNASVIGSTQIRCCLPDGGIHPGEGAMGLGDGPYWYERLEIPPQHMRMYFQVDLPGPGIYPVIFKLWSSSFYKKGDHDYRAEIQALPPAG